ncbi:hypothetical protein FCULG_00006593 [Lecanosticta acicola]|uniref:Uncharacterized protein n=1 Tax=Lecanosticta acicola TaxID=111012 RepID=A0AAI9E8L5_9PEZI|nr:hypothetical protein FCULG_00006593 [Lecanosticta acicola]
MPATYNTLSGFSATSPAREAFVEHYEKVRRICRKGRLLEYEVKQHWGPLCEFLEVPVPDEPIP